jgi:alpha-ketoglutaric semialdehyde dehydrogenase
MTTYRSFIDGEWINSTSGRTAPNINPANIDDLIGTIELASREEARRAVEAAYNAFREWKRTPAPARGRIVSRAGRLMEERKEELAQAITREEGKTISEARGETQRAINVVEFCAGESRRMNGETIPSELPANFAYTIYEPHGDRDPRLETRAGARRRKHSRVQAGDEHAADRNAYDRDLYRSGNSERSLEHGARFG